MSRLKKLRLSNVAVMSNHEMKKISGGQTYGESEKCKRNDDGSCSGECWDMSTVVIDTTGNPRIEVNVGSCQTVEGGQCLCVW